MINVGTRVFGLGLIALGLVCLAWGDFDFGQPVPKNFPARAVLAYAAAVFMLVAGAAVEWRRTVRWGAAALAVYFALIVALLMNGPVVIANYSEYGSYSGVAAQIAVAAGALIIYAGSVSDPAMREGLASAADAESAHRLITEWSPYAPAQRSAAV